MAPKTDSKKAVYSLGIDISGGFVRFAEISETDKGIFFENFSISKIPPGQDITDTKYQVIKALKDAYASLSKIHRKIFIVLSGPEVITRRVSLPKMGEHDLLKAIRWELKNHVPFPIEDAVIDYRLLGGFSDNPMEKSDLLAIAVSKELIQHYVSLFEAAGIKIDGISLPPFAIWNILRKTGILQKDKITVFMNIGAETTSLMFFNGPDLEFYREIFLAGNNITQALMSPFLTDKGQIELTQEQAEKVKMQYGIPIEESDMPTSEGITPSQILRLLKPGLRRFINEIERSFSYYKEQFQKSTIHKIIISGGSSKLKNMQSFLSANLESDVTSFADHFVIEKGPNIRDNYLLKEALPHLSIALGTAASQSKEINLLKKFKFAPKFEIPFNLDRLTSMFSIPKMDFGVKDSVFFGLTAAVTLLLTVYLAVDVNRQIASYQQEITVKNSLLSNMKVLAERQAFLEKIMAKKTPVRQAIAEITNLLPQDAILNQCDLTSGKMTISGYCTNISSVGTLIKEIELSPMFSSTNLIQAKSGMIATEVTVKKAKKFVPKKVIMFTISFILDR